MNAIEQATSWPAGEETCRAAEATWPVPDLADVDGLAMVALDDCRLALARPNRVDVLMDGKLHVLDPHTGVSDPMLAADASAVWLAGTWAGDSTVIRRYSAAGTRQIVLPSVVDELTGMSSVDGELQATVELEWTSGQTTIGNSETHAARLTITADGVARWTPATDGVDILDSVASGPVLLASLRRVTVDDAHGTTGPAGPGEFRRVDTANDMTTTTWTALESRQGEQTTVTPVDGESAIADIDVRGERALAVVSHPYPLTEMTKDVDIYRSSDAGRTWQATSMPNTDAGAVALTGSTAWSTVQPRDGGEKAGLFQSTDGGATWRPRADLAVAGDDVGIASAPGGLWLVANGKVRFIAD